MAAVSRGPFEHDTPRWWDEPPGEVGVVRRAADPAHPAAGWLAVLLLVVPAVVALLRPSVVVAVAGAVLVGAGAVVMARREGMGWPSVGLAAAAALGIAAFSAGLAGTIA